MIFQTLSSIKKAINFAEENFRSLLTIAITCALSLPAISQFSDDFSDGDFSVNPNWSGNTENFVVANNELQLNDLDPVLLQSYLSTPLNFIDLDNKEWRIKINQTFSGSDANQSRIYLTSNNSGFAYTGNNSAGVSGYFLKLGEALSADVIRFYKDDGISTTLIASGTTNISTSFDVSIKVVRDNAGMWTIGVDVAGGENFITEMNFTETSYNESQHFGIVCTYTSSNVDNFFFDNIYAGNVITDTTAPDIISATAINANDVDLLFSEPLEQSSAETEVNYNAPGLGTPQLALRDIDNPALVHLSFSSSLIANQNYTLSISNISDEASNIISAPLSIDFIWVQVATPNYRDVVFNEILADITPVVGLPEAEFVEIINTSPTSTFDLSEWKFVNTTTEKSLPQFLLQPLSYAILCDESSSALFSGSVIGIPSFSALTNAGDSLTLLDNSGQIIDIVVYSDQWFATDVKRDGGWTLELINPLLPCQSSGNWSESSNDLGGTPGIQNSLYSTAPDTEAPIVESIEVVSDLQIQIVFSESMDTTGNGIPSWSLLPFNSIVNATWNTSLDVVMVNTSLPVTAPNSYTLLVSDISDCSGVAIADTTLNFTLGFTPVLGDIIINEIMVDPADPVQLPNAEFVEIRNNTNTLLDLHDIQINDGYFTSQVLLEPDSFVVVTSINNEALFDTLVPNIFFMESFPGFTNTLGEITLSDNEGNVLDVVNYTIEWYNNAAKSEGGWTLERINPEVLCSGKYNWSASENMDGGTPGYENSIYNLESNGAPEVVGFGVLNETQIYIRFAESMDINTIDNINTNTTNGNIVSSPIWNNDRELLVLTMVNEIVPEVSYQLDLTGLLDCDGNQTEPSILSFMRGIDPQPGDLLINEILADGSDGSQLATPSVDFIEIHNTTSHFIEMTALRVNDGFFTEQIIIHPDSFLIITDDGNNPFIFLTYPNTAFMRDFPSLTENGMTIILSGDNGEIDRVSYNKTYYNDPTKESGGYSMERVNPEDPCSSSDNWRACVNINGTTAGSRNSVYDNSPDSTVPQLLYVLAEPTESITLVFNEPIDESTLTELIWIVNDELQENFNPYIAGDEFNRVVLQFGEMNEDVIYNFTLAGITDCWGNESALISSRFATPQDVSPGDILINEILYNPYDGGEDFIEIYNNSPKTISLNRISISDQTSGEMNDGDTLVYENLLFFPGEFFVITQNASQVYDFYPETKRDRIIIVEGLSDFSSDDKVFLSDKNGDLIDEVKYDESMHYALLNILDGISLERIAYNRPSNDVTNWHSASENAGFATPGYENSQSAIVQGNDGLMSIEPELFSPDNDGYNDVMTISYKVDGPGYTGRIEIFDSEGRTVRKLMTSELLGIKGSVSWDGFRDDRTKASIGIYVIHFEAFNTEGNVVRTKKACVLAHNLD